MGTSHEGLFTFMIIYGQFLFRMRNVSDRVLGTIKTPILYSVTFFWKSCHLGDNVEKYCRARQGHRWLYNMGHALCMLVN